jgi:tRNA A37 N6-isopentenylltransferase MiaA
MTKFKILRIIGPTATGKTALAAYISKNLLDEKRFDEVLIVNVDSRQVYKDLRILSGADLDEFNNFNLVKKDNFWQSLDYNLKIYNLAYRNFHNKYSLASFLNLFQSLIKKVKSTKALII